MFSQVELVGHLGKDPEMRYTAAGVPVTSFSVATNNVYTKKSGEKVEETTWWRVSVFAGQAEACNQYLHQGSLVLVVGRMTSDPETGNPKLWTDKSGQPHASYEVLASTVKFLTKSGGGNTVPEESFESPFD